MAKKVYKAWIGKSIDLEKTDIEGFFWSVEKHQNEKGDWLEGDWPPRRLTVTVETED